MRRRRTLATMVGGLVLLGSAVAGAFPADVGGQTAAPDVLKSKYQRPSAIPFPSDNGYTKEREALGRMLFFDPRLSSSNFISCSTCHNPAFSWGDALPRGIGHGMKELGRRSPTILNAAWSDALFWDGRARSLEDQALGPIKSPGEMNQDLEQLIYKLGTIPGYVGLFRVAYPGEGLTIPNVAKAIATFERTVVSGIAPFDQWIAGSENAISAQAKWGFLIFNTKARCAVCHQGWNFTDGSFHDIGLPTTDPGRGQLLPKLVRMKHAFKTPTLRNVDRRGPYMHDGSVRTLAEVVELYDTGGVPRESRSLEIRRLGLTAEEKDALVAFMKTLTSADAPIAVPELPR
jgi:cytochrome c peroxidase